MRKIAAAVKQRPLAAATLRPLSPTGPQPAFGDPEVAALDIKVQLLETKLKKLAPADRGLRVQIATLEKQTANLEARRHDADTLFSATQQGKVRLLEQLTVKQDRAQRQLEHLRLALDEVTRRREALEREIAEYRGRKWHLLHVARVRRTAAERLKVARDIDAQVAELHALRQRWDQIGAQLEKEFPNVDPRMRERLFLTRGPGPLVHLIEWLARNPPEAGAFEKSERERMQFFLNFEG